MSDYLALVWMGLYSSIIYAFVGFFVGLGVIMIIKKRQQLERHYTFLKIVTKLYFVYFPIVFCLTFWFAGSLWTTVGLVEKEVTKVILEIEEKAYASFIKDLNENMDAFLAEESIPTNDEIVSNFTAKYLDKDASTIYRYTMKMCLTTMLEYMIGKDSEREERFQTLSEGISKDLFKSGFGFLKDEVKSRIMSFAVFLSIPIVIGFFGAMFFPAMEILFYRVFLKPEEEE